MQRINFTVLVVVLTGFSCVPPAEACSRVLWNDNGHAVLVGPEHGLVRGYPEQHLDLAAWDGA